MKKKPFLSCIIPAYNVESYISRVIDSIIGQSFNDYEVIIIDDGSKDNTFNICQKYVELYPDIIQLFRIENKGVSNARNIGIDKAKGDFLYFMDSDDELYKKDFFQNFYNAVQRNPQIALFVQGYSIRYVNGDTNEVKDVEVIHQGKFYSLSKDLRYQILDLMYDGFMFVVWNKIFKNDIICDRHIRFENQYMEDFDFVLKYMSNIDSLLVLQSSGYRYYRESNRKSLVTQVKDFMIENYVSMHKKLNVFFGERFTKEVKQIMFPQYYNSIIKLVLNHSTANEKVLQSVYKSRLIMDCLNVYKPCGLSDLLFYNLLKGHHFNLYRILVKVRSWLK